MNSSTGTYVFTTINYCLIVSSVSTTITPKENITPDDVPWPVKQAGRWLYVMADETEAIGVNDQWLAEAT